MMPLSPEVQAVLITVVKASFIFFIVVSFVVVAGYSVYRVRQGRLFDPQFVPLPLTMQPPILGWLYAISVVGLIFVQPDLFPMIVLIGIGIVLLQNRRSFEVQFGLHRLRLTRSLSIAMLVFGAVVLVVQPLSETWNWALDHADQWTWSLAHFHLEHPDQVSVQTFRTYNENAAIIAFMIKAVLITPVIEELFFRGFLLTFLKNYTSTTLAVVISAGIFGFAHLNLSSAVPLCFFGIVLGMAYEHTGSLLVPIAAHACFNLATGLNLLIEKGTS